MANRLKSISKKMMTENPMNILDKFLKIEEDNKLYQFTFSYKDTLMHPFIRTLLLKTAIDDDHKLLNPDEPFSFGNIEKIRYYFKSFWYRPRKHIQSDIIFFGADIANIRQGNAYFNRLTESFANEYASKTILIEESYGWDYKRPRTYNRVFAKDFEYIYAEQKLKLTSILNYVGDFAGISSARKIAKQVEFKDSIQIDLFIQYLKENFDYKFSNENIFTEIKNDLLYYARTLPFLFEGYTKLFKMSSPKIIFVQCACYGGGNVPLIMAAKELKIPVGEHQHGGTSLVEPAYNYSCQLLDCYKYYMPDFFMAHGKYSIENSRIPINVLEIGYPNLSDTISQYGQNEKKEMFLYLSTTRNPEECVQEVIWLNAKLADKGCSLMFRPHPIEILRLQTVYKAIVDAGIPIDTQPLYETLKNTKYVCGDVSNVLFEAAGFNCIIFIRDKPYNRENVEITWFNVVQSMEEVVESIIFKKYKKTDPTTFWADNWRSRYKECINSYILPDS